MTGVGIADTGVIAAYLNRREQAHAWAVEQFASRPAPLLTCESVLSETSYVVRSYPGGPSGVLGLVRSGVLAARFDLQAELAAVAGLVDRYADVPMSLADACLVRMAELHPGATVLTLDSDFRVYRAHRTEPVRVAMPT